MRIAFFDIANTKIIIIKNFKKTFSKFNLYAKVGIENISI
jgi:hypothetical protein